MSDENIQFVILKKEKESIWPYYRNRFLDGLKPSDEDVLRYLSELDLQVLIGFYGEITLDDNCFAGYIDFVRTYILNKTNFLYRDITIFVNMVAHIISEKTLALYLQKHSEPQEEESESEED